ncbi:DUF4936 family protein [Noviherbaspirillum aridicola]|uniref:DUF4936 family protein n=1 Tax=Noviherbaspirillum aridicola TaxID=2849687 RepID=A0ABQ4QAN8_9BURK|nr:DUF4936 family protein [Noviherbaspirillum aridicola]GIZ54131.1 hypothetical protein NCCP691_41450 [Noviherbaspirillum aridicola]
MDLYIYYRVPPAHAAALQPLLAAMQEALSREHGVSAALKRRPEEKDGRQTWMEVYQDVPAGFDDALDRALAQSGAAALIDGPRHTEIFEDVRPCA